MKKSTTVSINNNFKYLMMTILVATQCDVDKLLKSFIEVRVVRKTAESVTFSEDITLFVCEGYLIRMEV
jgi:hypothetical protein